MAILDNRKSHSIAFLAISEQYATCIVGGGGGGGVMIGTIPMKSLPKVQICQCHEWVRSDVCPDINKSYITIVSHQEK